MCGWAGTFAISNGPHQWSMQKVGGSYADPAMRLILFPSAADKSEIDVNKATAQTLMEGTVCPEVEAGESMTPVDGGSCFELHVDTSADDSFFTIVTSGMTGLTVFAQHVPTEFERTMHYLKDSSGEDIEPLSFEKRWGPAIAAGFLVNLVTFAGIVFLVPVVYTLFTNNPNAFGALANAFASGALIACAFFLMFPEGYLYVSVGSSGEGNTAFLFGTMTLLGVITASVIDLVVSPFLKGLDKPKVSSTDAKEVAPDSEGFSRRSRVLGGVLIGDFAHNFCDGLFIGTAFAGCSNTMAWGITTATILHEIAQELSDYIVLTDPKQGNLRPAAALILNFVSGLSVVLGIVLVLSLEVGPRTIGCMLTLGGGVYIQIGLAECMGRVYAQATNTRLKLASITLFCIGAVAIGLILFNHEHCIAEGDDSHEGHDHGRL
jgi:zinc transporter ZupT